jgi:hypothetical protein
MLQFHLFAQNDPKRSYDQRKFHAMQAREIRNSMRPKRQAFWNWNEFCRSARKLADQIYLRRQ